MGVDRFDPSLDHKRVGDELRQSAQDGNVRTNADKARRHQAFRETPAYFVSNNSWSVFSTLLQIGVVCVVLLWFRAELQEETNAQKEALRYLDHNQGLDYDHPGHQDAVRDAKAINTRDALLGALHRMVFRNFLAQRAAQYEGAFFASITGAMQQDTVILIFGAMILAAVVYVLVRVIRFLLDRRMWRGEKTVQ